MLRLGVGLFASMNIAVFSWFFYSREFYRTSPVETHDGLAGLLAYLLLFLASIAIACLGGPLVADILEQRRVDATALIALGAGAAFVLSAVNTLRGQGPLYFDTAAIILVLVTLGRYVDATARQRAATSARELTATVPTRASVERDGAMEEIAVAEVRLDDRLRVRPGEMIPVDGLVREGEGHVDEAILTGESRPRSVHAGDQVLAGSSVVDAMLWLTPEHVGEDRAVARMQELLRRARDSRPPFQAITDRVAAFFVPGVVALCLAVLFTNALAGRWQKGLFDGLSVLLISCPCALGLASPLATWSALRRAAERGILIDSPTTLERAAAVNHVFFDKTGTITERGLAVTEVTTDRGLSETDAVALAASIGTASVHPVAVGLVEEARRRGIDVVPVETVKEFAGRGLEARVAARRLRLGSAAFIRQLGAVVTSEPSDETELFLAEGDQVLARFRLGERLRSDARSAVDALRLMGLEITVVTGDRPGPATRVAEALGVQVVAAQLPADKVRTLKSAREKGDRVAMVGDGMNDGPVLAAADVGIATATGTDLARGAGNVRLMTDRLDRIPVVIAIARHAMSRIRMSLAWAFAYNVVGLGLAAAGLLSPIFAAVAMILSSLYVVRCSTSAGEIGD